ncbi:MAG: AAA family ATPase [Gallionella sp.]|nr:AAA family ATPase [Gallionella sp.]
MYLRRLYIENIGPLRKLALEFHLTQEGNPKPVVLVGGNGSGKTNLLSIIADALFEAAAIYYTDVVPGTTLGSRPWFRVVGSSTISSGASGSCALLQFEEQESSYVYKQKGGSLAAEDITESLPESFKPHASWPKDGPVKEFPLSEDVSKKTFEQGAYLYFPSSRAEIPHWLNKNSLPIDDFNLAPRFTKQLKKPIYVESGIQQLKQWILSIIVEIRTDFQIVPAPNGSAIPLAIGHSNALAQMPLWESLNKILKAILSDQSARLVWMGRFSDSKIGFVQNGSEAPLPLEALSAGQVTLLNVFGTLLKYGDGTTEGGANPNLIKGICLIDEIDAHMHIDLQYRALPNLMQLFPKVQFIVSSHSPLFVLGMEQICGADNVSVIEMPSGLPIQAESYAEFGRALGVIQETKAFNQAVLNVAGIAGKLLVLLEGETDPIYLNTAAELLGRSSLLGNIEFGWVGSKHPQSGQGFHTGKDALNATANFLKAKPELVKREVVLLYDNDVMKTSSDEGRLHVRSMPTNPNNKIVESGIENLLPEQLLLPGMFDEKTSNKKNGCSTTTRTLNKMKLCKHLCETKRDPADFAEFSSVLDMIEAVAHF